MSMSQPAISSAVAGRPMPSLGGRAGTGCACAVDLAFGAAFSCAAARLATAPASRTTRAALRHFDILDLAVLVDVPRLNAVVMINRAHPAMLAQLGLARLHVAGLVDGARLQQQLAAVPVELVVEA